MEEQAKTSNKRRKRKVVIFSRQQLVAARDFLVSKYWTVKSGIIVVLIEENTLKVTFISKEKFRNVPNKVMKVPVIKRIKEEINAEEI